jgi:hypothetical protein
MQPSVGLVSGHFLLAAAITKPPLGLQKQRNAPREEAPTRPSIGHPFTVASAHALAASRRRHLACQLHAL